MRRLCFVVVACLAALASVHGYALKGPKWPGTSVGYWVNPTSIRLLPDDARAIYRIAADDWKRQANPNFTLKYLGDTTDAVAVYNRKNVVLLRNATHDTIGASTYCWSTGGTTMLDCDIVVWEGLYQFLADAEPCQSALKQLYLHDALTHEWGHFLGLGHSPVSGATMWAGIKYCQTSLRSLAADDKAGILKLYPQSSTTTTTTAPVSSAISNLNVVEGTVTGKQSRWVTNTFGDRLILSDLTLKTKRGPRVFRDVEGGELDGLTLTTSDIPDVKVGQRIRGRVRNGRLWRIDQ